MPVITEGLRPEQRFKPGVDGLHVPGGLRRTCHRESLSFHLGGLVSLAGAATSTIFVTTKVLSRQTRFCRDKYVFVASKHVTTKDLSRQKCVCLEKLIFVATKCLSLQTCICRDKTRFLSGQIQVFRD